MNYSGVPDRYYDGPGGDMWVEYKYIAHYPEELDLTDLSRRPSVSRLQDKWITRRWHNGHNAFVVLGVESEAVIFTGLTWKLKYPEAQLRAISIPVSQVAEWIHNFTGA
jgi:hypothetical protein